MIDTLIQENWSSDLQRFKKKFLEKKHHFSYVVRIISAQCIYHILHGKISHYQMGMAVQIGYPFQKSYMTRQHLVFLRWFFS